MRHKYKTIAAAACALLYFAWCAPTPAHAQSAPRTLSYQGVLMNTGTGTFASGSRLLTVTLYSDANGNNKLWQTTMNTQVDPNGVFNVLLGTADNLLPEPSVMDRPIWLGVAIDNGPELRPLSEVTASAYALNVADNAITTAKLVDNAVTSAKIADSSVTTAKLADHSVTWNKMGTEYVPYIRVNGAKVNTGNNPINFTGDNGLKVDYDSNSMSVIFHSDTSLSVGAGKKGGDLPQSLTPFSDLTSATNTTATMIVGSGASLVPSGTGAVEANQFSGVLPVGDGGTGTANGSWNLTGNALTLGQFLGTTNNMDVILKANGLITLQLHPTSVGVPNIIGGIGGATGNTISNPGLTEIQGSIIAGGGGSTTVLANSIVAPDDASTISGGEGNTVTNVTVQHGVHANANEANDGHVIGGGISNSIVTDNVGVQRSGPGAAGTIAGGQGNLLCGPFGGTIAGGQNNLISSSNPNADDDNAISIQMGFIGGGNSNSIGGLLNAPNQFGSFCVIAGGQNNHIGGGTVVGGSAIGTNGVIQGGTVTNPADDATIGGGNGNKITANEGFIGGGASNLISASGAVIGGGSGNTASNTFATVGGGIANTAAGNAASVGGGNANHANGDQSAIAGGAANIIDNSNTLGVLPAGEWGAIGGGEFDTAGRLSFVGGGLSNNAAGTDPQFKGGNIDCSAIIGGASLITTGQCQLVIGASNLPSGHNHMIESPGNPNNDCEFEIGSPIDNGTAWVQHNAFEVSYNGHSVVYHTNGSSMTGVNPVFQGGTYVESPVYAWGAFDHTGAAIGTANFGISLVTDLVPYGAAPGTYLVSLAPADPHGGPTPDITQCSVTVTVLNNNVGDITKPPPLPPQPMAPVQQVKPQPVPDSVIRALGGTVPSGGATNAPTGPAPACPIASETSCGFATASQIGITILGTPFPLSFIVRTYVGAGGTNACQQDYRAFFVKVCHR